MTKLVEKDERDATSESENTEVFDIITRIKRASFSEFSERGATVFAAVKGEEPRRARGEFVVQLSRSERRDGGGSAG